MNYKQSLRRRINLSFLLFGALLSLTITIGVYFAIEDIEVELVEESLQSELDYFLNQKNKPSLGHHQLSAKMELYYVDNQQNKIVPEAIRKLTSGHHDLKLEQELFHILVSQLDSQANKHHTVYMVRNATAFEQRETAIHTALIASVIVAILIALWLGSWLSGKVILPVSTLARQVAELKPGNHTPLQQTNKFADDEVGQLAATFDRYLDQLSQFIEREQEFTANASHELRTPLAVINSAAELLLENPQLSERVHGQIERIARAGNRMSQMVEVLLLLAREPVPGDSTNQQERCSLKEASLEVSEQHRFLTHDKALTLRCDIINDFEIEAPKAIVTIVLGNLVRNALIYTDEGEVVISVDNGQLEIKDSGPGIPAEQLAQIFTRHYRAPESGGNGIGLAIVKRICERQRWQIDIESEVGKGTTVRLRLCSKT
ncbi:MAG: HAMP domain-containing histidine kinase [Gammaproteobacteria bacterium]|nr:HAMP domain-containing histidine kinase [Gammaproteobacteria bacterium]